MPSIFTLSGPGRTRKAKAAKPTPEEGTCRCVLNPRTKRRVALCFVGKSKKNRSGWQFVKGGCPR
jgi:hypothetical protein